MTDLKSSLEGWREQPPYQRPSERLGFIPTRHGACHCGKVRFSVSRDRPLASKYCHCHECQALHGAPFQWAAIFQKSDMSFDCGTLGLSFYQSATKRAAHELPCKVSCQHCHTPIIDEGRNMVLLFPTLLKFQSDDERRLFEPECHIFYSQRVVDISDQNTKWSGMDGKSEMI